MGFESDTFASKIKSETAQINQTETDSATPNTLADEYENFTGENLTQTESLNEQWESEKAVIAYNRRKDGVSERIAEIEHRLHAVHLAEENNDLDETEIDVLIAERELMQREMVMASANYPGDWTNLLYDRLRDPASKAKFIKRRTEAMQYMKDGDDELQRREKPKAHYQNQVDSYDTTIERVFSMTEIGPAGNFGSRGRNLGNLGNEKVGSVFSDATHQGMALTKRQKNIIEAHEKGHCVRDFASPYDRQEIRSAIDLTAINELNELRQANGIERIAPTYVSDPMEIVERMSQFKNYFGLGADDTFTKKTP